MREHLRRLFLAFTVRDIYERTLQPFRKSVWFFSKSLFFAFVIMGVLYIPTLVRLPAYFDQQMSKFKSLSIDSNFTVSSPVYFPERDGLIIIDTTGLHQKPKYERFLITHEGVFFKLFRESHFIKAESFRDVLSHRDSFVLLFAAILVVVLPALAFWSYVFLWLKYLFLIIFLGSVFFTLFDLTHWRKSLKQMLGIAAYVSFVPMMIEVVSLPFGTEYLLPVFQTIGIDLYAVPLMVHSVGIVILAFVVHRAGKHVVE